MGKYFKEKEACDVQKFFENQCMNTIDNIYIENFSIGESKWCIVIDSERDIFLVYDPKSAEFTPSAEIDNFIGNTLWDMPYDILYKNSQFFREHIAPLIIVREME